ncbi:MAG: carotenoid biosynthesis protein [Vicingaceae bacterium]
MISKDQLISILENPSENRGSVSVFIIWLFMVSAMIGVSVGFETFFVPKTPLNLIVQTVLFFWVARFQSAASITAVASILVIGIGIEWIGIHYGLPFGNYSYGSHLGFKLDGVPLLIGTNWLLLSWCSHSLLEKTKWNRVYKALLSSLLMVLLDIPMEIVAPEFDFWAFEPAPPWINYFAWGVIAFVMQLIIQQTKHRINEHFAFHYYLSQILFFSYFAWLY